MDKYKTEQVIERTAVEYTKQLDKKGKNRQSMASQCFKLAPVSFQNRPCRTGWLSSAAESASQTVANAPDQAADSP